MWFEDDQFWCALQSFIFSPEVLARAEGEVISILKLTGFHGTSVLDLCCGIGRHSIPLAARGFKVTGMDLTQGLLNIAKASAAKAGVNISWRREDMREFKDIDTFDLCINLYNSFGYFLSEDDDAKVIANIFRSLRKGGMLVIDTPGKELAARSGNHVTVQHQNESHLYREIKADPGWCTLAERWCFVSHCGCAEYSIHHNVYSGLELTKLLRDGGFEQISVYGDFDGQQYDSNAKRLVVLATK